MTCVISFKEYLASLSPPPPISKKIKYTFQNFILHKYKYFSSSKFSYEWIKKLIIERDSVILICQKSPNTIENNVNYILDLRNKVYPFCGVYLTHLLGCHIFWHFFLSSRVLFVFSAGGRVLHQIQTGLYAHVCLMLAPRRRHCPNIKPTLD